MGALGKYIRHGIAAAVGAALAFLVTTFDLQFDPDQQAAIVTGGAVLGYAMVEKLLKRFGWLDPEGAADRDAIKAAAQDAQTRF